ncbi:2'-5' RNA ligase family protein [Actinokineospora guangxiensis]|uniref:2'-5' RNA ligase family protein n=1 Tax=Actinokineospora guangxiensis TaxID=1490288 RepID=A0ABW0EIT2_9PSEU
MAQGVAVFFDDAADSAVRKLWARLDAAGLPSERAFPPHLSFALASDIPAKTRAALRAELRVLHVPSLQFAALSTFATTENVLMLSAVTDPELLAVHSAVHDVLAGRVRNPSAYYMPGSWVPHCTLVHEVSDDQLVRGFGAVFPVPQLRARVAAVAVIDTATGEIDRLT